MRSKLEFSKIELENIFNNDFKDMQDNEELLFITGSNPKFSTLYAPNGTGKTSLVRVLSGQGSFNAKFSQDNQSEIDIFSGNCQEYIHVIENQIARRNIVGVKSEYLIGSQIKRQTELRNEIEDKREHMYKSLIDQHKALQITSGSSNLISYITDEKLKKYTESLCNTRDKGTKINFYTKKQI